MNTTVAPFPVLAHFSTSRYSTDMQRHPHYATHKWDFRGLHRACLQWLKPLMFKCMYFKCTAVMSDINNSTENGLGYLPVHSQYKHFNIISPLSLIALIVFLIAAGSAQLIHFA